MPHDVFISYSTKDQPIADAVCAALEQNGLRCWMAPRDILPGENWGGSIVDAIAQSRLMVVVFSAASNSSPQVMREVERAASKGIPIVPMRIADVAPSKAMEFFLSVPHWLDAITPPIEAHITRLASVVQSILKPVETTRENQSPPYGAWTTNQAKNAQAAAAPANVGKLIASVAATLGKLWFRVSRGRKSLRFPGETDLAPLTASELRSVSQLRDRANTSWSSVQRLPPEPGLRELLAHGASLQDAIEQLFSGEQYRQVSAPCHELLATVQQIRRTKIRRDAAERARDRVEALQYDARAFDVRRHSPTLYGNAERFLKQAAEAYRLAGFETARDHWREAEREVLAAIKLARPARLAELRQFVVGMADLLNASAYSPGSTEKNQRTMELANACFVAQESAEPLVAQAWKLVYDPTADPLPNSAIVAALQLRGTGLGPTAAQRSVLREGTSRYWPLVVFGAYIVVLASLIIGMLLVGALSLSDGPAVSAAILAGLVSVLAGGLLLLPVRAATRRPVRRRSLWAALLSSGALAGLLVAGSCLAGFELLGDAFGHAGPVPDIISLICIGLSLVAWPTWIVIFWAATKDLDSVSASGHFFAWLIRGSIVELLVAVPCHLWVRRRHHCSVGNLSAAAIVIGTLVAFLTMGPAMLLLYSNRAGKLQKQQIQETRSNRRVSPNWILFGALAFSAAVSALVIDDDHAVLGMKIYFVVLLLAGWLLWRNRR